MESCLASYIVDELSFVCQVIDLFKQIDLNGDGRIEWHEFTSYIVDAALTNHEAPTEQGFHKMQYMESQPRALDTITNSPVMLAAMPKPIDQLLVVNSENEDICEFYKVEDLRINSLAVIRPTQSKLRHSSAGRRHICKAVLYDLRAPIFLTASDEVSLTLSDKKPDVYFLTQWETKGPYYPFMRRATSSHPVSCISYCHNPSLIITGCRSVADSTDGPNAFIIMRDVNSLNPVTKLKWHTCEVTRIIVVDGNFYSNFISAGKDGTIAVWSTKTGAMLPHAEGGGLSWMV